MITRDFVKDLRQHGEVQFGREGRSVVEARLGSLAVTLAEALISALGPESKIHGGYQTTHFEDDFTGEHVWWLVLDTELLKVWITMIGQKGSHTGADVHLQFYSLREPPPPEAVFTYVAARGPSGNVVLREMKCRIAIGDREPLELQAKGADVEGAQLFFVALQAARHRAWAGRATE